MSKVNGVLVEAESKLLQLKVPNPIVLTGRVVLCYNVEDLLDTVKAVKSYPIVGIVYEGMHSVGEEGSTAKVGLSASMVLSLILLEQGDAIHSTDQKKTRSIDYLDAMRDQFMGERSPVTGHYWHFLVESPAELKAGMVAWVQRWSLPVQVPPKRT